MPGGTASAAPPGATVVDGFNRVDGGLGVTETGQTWALWSGSMSVVGQQAQAPAGGYNLAVVDAGLTTGSAALTVTAPSNEYWMILRGSDSSNYWRFGRWQGGAYQLQQVAGGGLGSPSLSTLATVNPAAGDRLSCQMGSGLSCTVNGTAVVSTTDMFNSSARFTGFAAAGGAATTRFDDVLVASPPSAPDLKVSVAAAAATVDTGAPVSWTTTVLNDGSVAATNTVVALTLPSGLSGATVSSSAGTCSGTGTSRSCSIGTRAAGSSATVTIAGAAPTSPTTLTLGATASAAETDADPASNTGSSTVTVRTPLPAGAVVVDGFNRADTTNIGSTETSQAWATWSGSVRVVSSQAEASAGGYDLITVDSGTAVGTVAATVTQLSSEFWLIFRATDPSNYWRFGRWQGGNYQLQQVVNAGLGSPSLTSLATVSPAAGNRLSCNLAAEITCSVGGTAVVMTSDTFNGAAKRSGFAAAGATDTRFDDMLVTTPPPAPDLRVSITASAPSVFTGGSASWTATVRNDGTVPATGTVVTVIPPAGLTNTLVSSTAGACVPGGGSGWTCSIGSRAVGSSATVSVSGTAPNTAGTITLTVSATANETDANPATNSASNSVTVRVPPPPGAVVVDGFDRANGPLGTAETGQSWATWLGAARIAGQNAEATGTAYTLAVVDSGTSAGTVAANVTTLSPEFWLIARASSTGNYWRFGRTQGGTYQLQQVQSFALGSPTIIPGSTLTPAAGDRLSCRLGTGLSCSVNGTVVASTTDGFNATARYAGFAANVGAVAGFDEFLVVTPPAAPDLRVAVTAANSSVTVGTTVSWTAVVTNDGTVSATATSATVTLPAGLTGTGVTSNVGICAGVGTTRTCSLGTRAVGSSATITVQATAPAQPATIVLTVSASSAETDADPSSDSASAAVSVRNPVQPGEVVSDGFNRANASTLGSTSTGQLWSVWSGGFGISSNAAAPGASGGVATVDPGWAYGTYEVTVTAGATSGFSVVLRGKDASNNFRVGPDGAGNYRLWKIVNGAVRDPQFQIVRADVRAKNGDVIRIVNRPDDGIWVGVNGQHVIDGGDVDLLGQARIGLAAASSTVRFDNLWIGQTMSSGMTTIDNFSDPDGTVLNFADSGTRYSWRSDFGYWETQSGRAVQAAPGYGVAWMDNTSELADAKVTVPNAGIEAWLLVRFAENGDYLAFGRDAGGIYRVERVVGSNGSAVAGSQVASLTAQANDVLEVRQLTNGRVEGWVRGVKVVSFTDTSFNVRATAYGLAGSQSTSFDTFSVTPK